MTAFVIADARDSSSFYYVYERAVFLVFFAELSDVENAMKLWE
jgi:hypothetical protein